MHRQVVQAVQILVRDSCSYLNVSSQFWTHAGILWLHNILFISTLMRVSVWDVGIHPGIHEYIMSIHAKCTSKTIPYQSIEK